MKKRNLLTHGWLALSLVIGGCAPAVAPMRPPASPVASALPQLADAREKRDITPSPTGPKDLALPSPAPTVGVRVPDSLLAPSATPGVTVTVPASLTAPGPAPVNTTTGTGTVVEIGPTTDTSSALDRLPAPEGLFPEPILATPPAGSFFPSPMATPTSDISVVEKSTFNGRVYDETGAPLDGVTVKAKSLSSGIPFESTATTSGGSYFFNNSPSGISVEITASKSGFAPKRQVVIIKSNKIGDPNANRFDFGNPSFSEVPTSFGGGFHNAISDKPEVTSIGLFHSSADEPVAGLTLSFSEPMDIASVESALGIYAVATDTSGNTAKSLVWDRTAFEITWNPNHEQVTLRFKANQPKLGDILSHEFAFNENQRLVRDKSGIARNGLHFKVNEGRYQESLTIERIVRPVVLPTPTPASTPVSTPIPTPTPTPVTHSLLTAGEWSDLVQWPFWLDVIQSSYYGRYQRHWRFNATRRFSVQVKTGDKALADIAVTLKNRQSGQILYQARTNNQGQAELLLDPFGNQGGGPYEVAMESPWGSASAKLDTINTASRDPIVFSLPSQTAAPPSKTLDLMLVVDTTGSMGDELDYLKAELRNVVDRVQQANGQQLAIRLSANFYRDQGDEYVVRPFPFTTSVAEVQSQLRAQQAGGGGDFPEALDLALADAIQEHAWSDQARARILFLVLDAPPHQDHQGVVERLHRVTQEASRKGIRIIPVASSGIDKPTEFLLRFLAIATGGTYTFLTDHSGIGGTHLKPTIGKYQVEKLNDLMVRLVNQYVH